MRISICLKLFLALAAVNHLHGKATNFVHFALSVVKLIDLGAWANGDYTLPTEDAPQAEDS